MRNSNYSLSIHHIDSELQRWLYVGNPFLHEMEAFIAILEKIIFKTQQNIPFYSLEAHLDYCLQRYCSANSLVHVKYLLEQFSIQWDEENALNRVMVAKNVPLTRYLLQEAPNPFDIHTNEDAVFKKLCRDHNTKMLTFLLLEMNMEVSLNLQQWLTINSAWHIKDIINKRNFCNSLNLFLHKKEDRKYLSKV